MDEDKKGDETSEKKGDQGLDAADVTKRLASLESRSTKSVLTEVAERNALVAKLTPHIGTFVHDAMDATEVAEYGLKKLELTAPKGQERLVLSAFLQGKGAAPTPAYGMDSKSGARKAGAKDPLLEARRNRSNETA